MKIFGIICMSIMLGIAFVDMVAVFTNFVEKSKKEWVKKLFYNLTNDFFSSLFMCYDYRNYYSSLRKDLYGIIHSNIYMVLNRPTYS